MVFINVIVAIIVYAVTDLVLRALQGITCVDLPIETIVFSVETHTHTTRCGTGVFIRLPVTIIVRVVTTFKLRWHALTTLTTRRECAQVVPVGWRVVRKRRQTGFRTLWIR